MPSVTQGAELTIHSERPLKNLAIFTILKKTMDVFEVTSKIPHRMIELSALSYCL